MDNRIHKVHTDKGVFDAYKYYKTNVIQQGRYKLTRTEFSKILKLYYTAAFTEAIYNNRPVNLGRLGEIKIIKYKKVPKLDVLGNLKYNVVDWKKTKELGKWVLNFNDSTEGYMFKFKWITKMAIVNKTLFKFKVSRDISRALPKALKENKHLNFEEYGRR